MARGSGSGTIIKASRPLKGHERRYLWRRWSVFRGGQAGLVAALLGLLAWGVLAEDSGLKFLFALLVGPAWIGIRRLGRRAAIFGRDLQADRVESVIGAVGALDLSPGLVPLYLGEREFVVLSELLNRKRPGEPIMVEYLTNTGLAVAIDGKSNLLSLKRWFDQ